MSSKKTLSKSSILFFLGADASVAAGVSDVRGLVKDFKEWLISGSKIEQAERIEKIASLIKVWLSSQIEDREVDIELLLETIEKLENIEKNIASAFFINEKNLVAGFKGNNNHSRELKVFMRTKCFVPDSCVTYLEPLIDFIDDSGVLNIFSTNYDNSLEQFCDLKDIGYIDGFDSAGWNSQTFRDVKRGIKIYKLHGSITWWRTEEGDYKSIPIRDNKESIMLSSGKAAVPLILYPGKKLKYNEPIFDILFELKQLLRIAEYVVVVGYSFKDKHITRIFRYAAKKNRKFIMLFISPSAFEIFDDKLKYHEDEDFLKGFTSGYDQQGYTSPVSSKLIENRVIPLPYKFEKVLPILKNRYLDNLIETKSLERRFKTSPEESIWNEMIDHYVDCEHIQKVEDILNVIGWEKLATKDWRWSLGTNLKVLINRLLSTDKTSRERWTESFLRAASILQFDRFRFTPTLGMQTVTFPPHIELRIGDGTDILPKDVSDYLQGNFMPILEDKLRLIEDEEVLQRLRVFLDKIRRLKRYYDLWNGDRMTFQSYIELRRNNFPQDIEDFRRMTQKFSTTEQNEQGQERVREIVERIERNEIREIYNGAFLQL